MWFHWETLIEQQKAVHLENRDIFSLCKRIPKDQAEDRALCFQEAAALALRESSDETLCEYFVEEMSRESCRADVLTRQAESSGNVELCNKIRDPFRSSCYGLLLNRLSSTDHDYTIEVCELLEDGFFRRECYYLFLDRRENAEICHNTQDLPAMLGDLCEERLSADDERT